MTHHLTRFHTFCKHKHTQHTHSSAVAVAHCRRCLRRSCPLPSLPLLPRHCCLCRHHEPINISPRRILKKYRQAANKAVLNVAIDDLVAARKVRHADGGKRLIKSNHSYKNVIASLQSVGVGITYDALMKRVARASVEDIIAEIRIPKSSAESEVSSLSPRMDYSSISYYVPKSK